MIKKILTILMLMSVSAYALAENTKKVYNDWAFTYLEREVAGHWDWLTTEQLKESLDQGLDPNSFKEKPRRSLLVILINVRKLDLVKMLLEAGADPKRQSYWGFIAYEDNYLDALEWCSKISCNDKMYSLVKKYHDVNKPPTVAACQSRTASNKEYTLSAKVTADELKEGALLYRYKDSIKVTLHQGKDGLLQILTSINGGTSYSIGTKKSVKAFFQHDLLQFDVVCEMK